MAQFSKSSLLGLLFLATSASATTVGPIEGKPVMGRPLEVNIPVVLDKPKDRACASANVRYGSARAPRSILAVQGKGLNRNLLVTSRTAVNEDNVTVDVRVGCGAKAVTRRFVMSTNMSVAKSPPQAKPRTRQDPAAFAAKPGPKPVALVAPLVAPGEPLFPPPEPVAAPPEGSAPKADAALMEELQKARAEAATAIAQLEAARKELAAVLDVEQRTRRTLINSDNQARNAQSEVARMRLVLQWVGAALGLGAAGLVWWEFQRVALRMRRSEPRPAQEPTIFAMPAEPSHP